MAQVKVHDHKDEEVTAAAVKDNQVKDSKGRLITLRELDPLQESRLTVAVGAEMAMNVMYMNLYAFPVAAVADIDGDDYAVPQNAKQVETMLSILGKEGLKAVTKYLRIKSEEESAADAVDAAAKN